MPDPIQKPGGAPSPEKPTEGPEKSPVGAGQGDQKAFQMPSGAEKTSAPSPMEVARDAGQSQKQVPPEELTQQIERAKQALQEAHAKLQDPKIQKGLTEDHYNALSQVTDKMNGDLRTIAQNSNGKFEMPQLDSKKNPVERVADWINGSQSTLTGALNYLSTTKNPNIASYMKLQYGIQRATQRAELFSSIVGSSVSGIKTIMSTQLG
ncbi:MAG: hypothetical protein H7A36_03510 [Chlamydiales bacterium]|nr:hypothetical protein [Chlamydiales bacterium]